MYNSHYDIIKTAFINNCFDLKEIADIFQEYGITDSFTITFSCESLLKDKKIISDSSFTQELRSVKYDENCRNYRYLEIKGNGFSKKIYDEDTYEETQTGVITILDINNGGTNGVTSDGTPIFIYYCGLEQNEDFLNGHDLNWFTGKKLRLKYKVLYNVFDCGVEDSEHYMEKFEILD